MIAAVAGQLLGLFVDDGFLAVAILAAVAIAALMAHAAIAPGWVVGLVLTLALPAALAASVALGVRRARQETRAG